MDPANRTTPQVHYTSHEQSFGIDMSAVPRVGEAALSETALRPPEAPVNPVQTVLPKAATSWPALDRKPDDGGKVVLPRYQSGRYRPGAAV